MWLQVRSGNDSPENPALPDAVHHCHGSLHRPGWRKRLLVGSLLIGFGGLLGACSPSTRQEEDKTLALPASALNLELSGTGFFVDSKGDLVTAGHAAAGCAEIFIKKGSRTYRAKVLALSPEHDLALLKIPRTVGLPVVFTRSDNVMQNDLVFAASYAVLSGAMAGRSMLSNAVVSQADGDQISLVSDADHGTSGAPVLNAKGLVIGTVTRRLSRSEVRATSVVAIKAFLSLHHIAFEEDDAPQLSALQDHARRAASLSVNVVCYKQD